MSDQRSPVPVELNAITLNKLRQAISVGANLEMACGFARIKPAQLHYWLKRGQKEDSGPYHDLYLEVRHAEAQSLIAWLMHINKAAAHNWTAAAWLAERRYPDIYGKTRTEKQRDAADPKEETDTIRTSDVRIEDVIIADDDARKLAYQFQLQLQATNGNAGSVGSECERGAMETSEASDRS